MKALFFIFGSGAPFCWWCAVNLHIPFAGYKGSPLEFSPSYTYHNAPLIVFCTALFFLICFSFCFQVAMNLAPDDQDLAILREIRQGNKLTRKIQGELKDLKTKIYILEDELRHCWSWIISWHPNFRNSTLLDLNTPMKEQLLLVCFLASINRNLRKSALEPFLMYQIILLFELRHGTW